MKTLLLVGVCAVMGCGRATVVEHQTASSILQQAILSQSASTIRSNAYGLVLDAAGASTANGAAIIEWSPNGGDNQKWTLVAKSGSDAFFVVNVHSGKCLDVTNGYTNNGALLQQWDCWGGDNQAWRFVQQGDGSYEVVGLASNRCIDAPLDIRTSGVRAQLWDCGGAANQRWFLDNSTSNPAPTPTPTPTPTPNPTRPAQFSFNVSAKRGGATPTYVRPNMYDYAPTVMYENGVYRMWWCASVNYEGGDHIFHAQANSLDGPWHAHDSSTPNSADDVFQPTYSNNDWDGQDTCDPSVLHVNGTYYLYYGGFPITGAPVTQVTAVGLATSQDGLNFTRVKSTPIITPARSTAGLWNVYGAGQPSVIYYNNMFYLAYTDTTGVGSAGPGPISGAGIFVLRSQDPTFATGVEELQSNGFAQYDGANHTRYPIVQAYTVDWAYSDALDRFFLVWNTNNGYSTVYVFDHNLTMLQSNLSIDGTSNDGPGLAALPNRHLMGSNACNVAPIDVMRAVSDQTGNTGPYSWDLAHAGVDLQATFSCY